MEKAHPHGLVAGVQKLGDIGDSETTCGDGVQHLHLDGSCGGRVGASAACGLPRGASLPPSWPSASLPRAWAGPGSSRHPGLRQLALNCESLTWAHVLSGMFTAGMDKCAPPREDWSGSRTFPPLGGSEAAPSCDPQGCRRPRGPGCGAGSFSLGPHFPPGLQAPTHGGLEGRTEGGPELRGRGRGGRPQVAAA